MPTAATDPNIKNIFNPFARNLGKHLKVQVKFVGYKQLDNRHEFLGVYAVPKSVSQHKWENFLKWFYSNPKYCVRGDHQWAIREEYDFSQLDKQRLMEMGVSPASHTLYLAAYIWNTGGVL